MVEKYSSSRRRVLVAHSMAGIIATRTARLLRHAPELVISLEGNLSLADAYFSGEAANFDDPLSFYAAFQSKILDSAKHDEVLRRYSCSLQFADPKTLWTLGRSAVAVPHPGQEFMDLACPSIYYWDPETTTPESKTFLIDNMLRQRMLEGFGHWPTSRRMAS